MDALENLTFANPAFCRMLGYEAEELRRMNLVELATRDSFANIVRETLVRKKGLTSRYEIQLISKDGTKVHVELASSPMFGDSNQYTGAIAVVRDITKLIELRQKYQKFLKREKEPANDIVSICASCKNVRRGEEDWEQVEDFFSHVVFSHGICPTCCEKLYPDIDINELDDLD